MAIRLAPSARQRRRWAEAEWIDGSGRWAVVARCNDAVTVTLHTTREDAERALDHIGRIGCGGMCLRDHRLIDTEGSP